MLCVIAKVFFFLFCTLKLLNSIIWLTCFIHVSSIKERSQKYFMCGKYYNCIFVFDNFSTMQIIWPQSNSSTHLSFSSHTLPKVRFVGCSGIWKTPPPLLKMDLLTYSLHTVCPKIPKKFNLKKNSSIFFQNSLVLYPIPWDFKVIQYLSSIYLLVHYFPISIALFTLSLSSSHIYIWEELKLFVANRSGERGLEDPLEVQQLHS